MLAKSKDYYYDRVGILISECTAVLAIAYCFLTNLPFSTKIVVALVITVFMSAIDRLVSNIELSKKETLESVWRSELTLRIAVDEILEQIRVGVAPQANWREASQQASIDIQSAKIDGLMLDAHGLLILYIFRIMAVIVLPFFIFLRVAIGYALAWGAAAISPSLARAITSG